MCGIAGIIAAEAARHEEGLAAMVAVLNHRGPDETGTHIFGNCALGHSRLSIIDLVTGKQPMLAADDRVGITFNGEIYGYRGIREQLAPYPFRTTSDTEVLLALYQKHGESMMSRVPGMFAFAIWDDPEQALFCARDRFGEKPFYYAIGTGGEFVFASEIKAILASGLVQPVISRASLAHYLRKLYVHPTRTIYENVHVLPPAHVLRYHEGEIKVTRYWQLPETRDSVTLSDAVEEFAALFSQATKRQLVSDVPVGAFLSGGLDSTNVVASAVEQVPNLLTFSFGFRGDWSELPFARAAADLYQTNHSEVQEEAEDIAELLLRMQDVYDEPFADSSSMPTYALCRAARREAKVFLTGDGGDELLAGYTWWYNPLHNMELEKRRSCLGEQFLRASLALARWFRLGCEDRLQRRRDTAHLWTSYGSIAGMHAELNRSVAFTREEIGAMGIEKEDGAGSKSTWQPTDTVDDALRMDLEDYMPGDILVKIDRASMAHGLELRAPFLDVDFASFCISLPSRLKINGKSDKLILRETFAERWPQSIRTRNKQGFGVPLDDWLEQKSVQVLVEEYLHDPQKRVFGLISYKACQAFLDAHSTKRLSLLVLALWAEGHSFE